MTERRRPFPAALPRRRWWLGTVVLLLLLAAYAVWSVVTTRSDLLHAQENAARVQLALQQDDSRSARAALTGLQSDLEGAHGRTDGPLWGLATLVPFLGDDAAAVRTAASVGDRLARGPLQELVSDSDGELRNRLVPRNGQVDIGAVESIAPLVSRLHRDLNESAVELRGVPTDHLTRWIRPAYDALATQVTTADTAMSAADRAVRVLPTMLGKDGPKRYLLLFDNNAEIRATGGLPGAFGLIEADHGRLSLIRQGAGADIAQFPEPVLEQSDAESEIYDAQIAEYLLDTNVTPEFPRTAELVREMWQRHAHQELDGVLSVDAVSMSYLLRATGLVTAPGGIPLTPQNASAELLNKVYFRLSDPTAQNEFFTEVARRVFNKVVAGVDSVPALFSALGQGVLEGRMYVHDFDPAVQRVLSGSSVAGEILGGDPRVPQVGVYLNDATGSKMSYYLRTRARLSAQGCAGGEQQLEGAADLTYVKDSPAAKQLPEYVSGGGGFGTEVGQQLVFVRVYGPLHGELSDFRVAGVPTDADVVQDRGRPVGTTVVQLGRGDTVRVSWRVRSGPHQDRPARLTVTPGMMPQKAVQYAADRCDAVG